MNFRIFLRFSWKNDKFLRISWFLKILCHSENDHFLTTFLTTFLTHCNVHFPLFWPSFLSVLTRVLTHFRHHFRHHLDTVVHPVVTPEVYHVVPHGVAPTTPGTGTPTTVPRACRTKLPGTGTVVHQAPFGYDSGVSKHVHLVFSLKSIKKHRNWLKLSVKYTLSDT